MGAVSPLDQFSAKTGLTIQSILVVVGLGFIVGVTESGMQPFESPVYIAAAALTYVASAQWGMWDGLFVACGVFTILLMGSIFRTDASLYSFFSEMPADFVLFFALGILPGFAVELWAGNTREIDAERANIRKKIADLNVKLAQVSKEKRAQADQNKPDEGKWNRRGNQLGDAGRRMVAAESQAEVLDVFGSTLYDSLQPERFFLAVSNGMGGLQVNRVEPAMDQDLDQIAAEDQILKDVARSGKPLVLAGPSSIGPDGLSANVFVPVIVNKQVLALVGLELSEQAAKEELDFVTIVAHLAQEVSARFGLN